MRDTTPRNNKWYLVITWCWGAGRRCHIGETLKQVPKFRELQVPNFQVPGASSSDILKKINKKLFFLYFNKKHFRYCLLPFHAFPSSGNFKFLIFIFRELQVPTFWKKLTKNCFFSILTKNILDTAFCLFTHYSIAKLRAWMELNVVF